MLYHRDVLKAASLAVSTDETRTALTGVYLDGKRAVATDGHILIAIDSGGLPFEQFPSIEGLEAQAEPVIAPTKALLEACKATPRNGHLPVLQCVAVGKAPNGIRIVATEPDRTHNATVRGTESVYPNWENVIPKGEPVVKTALTVDVVLKLFKALKAAGCQTVNVDIIGGNIGWKIEGTREGLGRVQALLMPCIRSDK